MSTAPVLDDDALHRLAEQLDDRDALHGFLRRYLGLLDQRIARLEHALHAGDREEWKDAVLSLRASSAMAGAQALAERAAAVEQEPAACSSRCVPVDLSAPGTERPRRATRMEGLRRLAAETARQLRLVLDQGADAAGPARSAPRAVHGAPRLVTGPRGGERRF